jgi:DNA mismatch repair protein MutL
VQDPASPYAVDSPVSAEEAAASSAPSFDFRQIRLLGSVFGTYLIGTLDEELFLIDQHAAHERVFYEKLCDAAERGGKERQLLLTPQLLQLSPAQKAAEGDWLPLLRSLGYAMDEFGAQTYAVREIPAFLSLSESEAVLQSILSGADSRNREKLMMQACKAAVKGNQALDPQEMQALLAELSFCRRPFTCPHGRPTVLRLTQGDLERMFKRS